jgi:hypothetical protein
MKAYEFQTNINGDSLKIPLPYLQELKTGEIVKVIILREEKTEVTIQEQWSLQFQTWVNSHQNQNLPLLSDIDISRESIYQRGE